ncbi:MAG: transcriptional repressor, partial [Salibacteraceae bacterium]|nr:transcriptional repressor [Salibacteraceae bacterium]
QFERSFANRQHDHIIFTETGEVKEFCDPRLQLIKKSLEESLGIKILHHSLNFYAVANTPEEKTEE